jgi:hypothetical protein
VSEYPEPRAVVIPWADTQRLTVLESARACVLAGVKPERAQALMRRYARGELEPEELLEGALLLYAIGYELELRRDPSVTWEAWQGVRLTVDVAPADPMLEAEARASVRTAIATGLPPAVAGQLTGAEVAAYADAFAERERGHRPAQRRHRVRR